MIGPLTKALTNPTLTTLSQNTNASVATETVLKSIGRPGFILIDNDIDPDTKKYAAAKEFLYQATCLLVYAALVVPVFKRGAFKLAKNKIFKNSPEFQKFKSLKNYESYRKYAAKSLDSRKLLLQQHKLQEKFTPEIEQELITAEKPDNYDLVKGVIEFGSITGSVLGLAVLAPQLSHAVIHPALRFIGMEEKTKKNHNNNTKKSINTNA
ncbi:MAG: hypothetical protein KIC80_00425 [Brachyspira sp.]|nr:hypothetical protein [Brachyspira sp.]